MKRMLLLISIFALNSSLFAQIEFKRDDFVGNTEGRWWKWHNDPIQVPSIASTSVENGYASFDVVDAIISPYAPFYCDAALWDGFPIVGGPWGNVEVKLRVKSLTPMQYGSRGWGLWYTEGSDFSVSEHIWFMQSAEDPLEPSLNWWRASKINGQTDWEYSDLSPIVYNNEDWHTYEIVRNDSYVEMLVDGQSVLYTDEDLPEGNMAFHIWVDNLVYDFNGSSVDISQRAWTGTHSIILDYVQIKPESTVLDKSEEPNGIKLLRQVPNDIFSLETQQLWKDYSFTSASGGNFVFLITGRAEFYTGESPAYEDDDLRFVIDGTDYLWNSSNSFNPAAEGTIDKTMFFQQTVAPGTSNIEVHAESSPLLYDVTILGNETGSVLFNTEYNETKVLGTPGLWKEINFSTGGGEVAVYVSGTADGDPFPPNYGYNTSMYDDGDDDDLKIILDGMDYSYQSEESFFGNRLFGNPKSILITENFPAGDHTLQIHGAGTPSLYRVVIYGNDTDVSLPVSLTSFNGTLLPDANQLEWITESEINNFGFNIYRAESKENVDPQELEFIQINDAIISGAGNSSVRHTYSFKDKKVKNDMYYWYQLEDIDYEGVRTQHNIVSLYRENILPGKFEVYNNYPNPFNGSTNISFYLANDTPVLISFFDSKGQEVQKVAPKIYSQGLNKFTWKNNDLTSGIYYCNISAFQNSQTIKMLYVK